MNLRDFWISYIADCVPKGADSVQLMETQKAFYAGASSAMEILSSLPEDEVGALVAISSLADEIKHFVDVEVSELYGKINDEEIEHE